jgi:hypothetical protein
MLTTFPMDFSAPPPAPAGSYRRLTPQADHPADKAWLMAKPQHGLDIFAVGFTAILSRRSSN